MNSFNALDVPQGHAICYSGFRDGQYPGGDSPSYEEIKEDLLILGDAWQYLRLYDCDDHALTVLDVIEKEKLDFKVMLGAHIDAEMNNYNCPWGGGVYTEEELEANKIKNQRRIETLIELGNDYPEIIFSLSVGNEACVDWTDHYVHEDKVLDYVLQVKAGAPQLVTFCENYVPWIYKLEKLAEAVDFISIHSYPVWEYKHILEGLEYTKQNYYSVADKYPNKPVVITEAGWATQSNGKGINQFYVNEVHQKTYLDQLINWTDEEHILTFVFEAFDENWKGAPEPLEPEKHWGIYKTDRTPKLAAQHLEEILLTET
jgi:exo-beta-1,3-glucanase (GH17 family)